MPMLKVENVTKRFGDIHALEDITFDVEPGEFVFLTGPSGAGKTTVLRMILRELTPDSGSIWLEDTDIVTLKNKEIPKLRQQIGVVFQDFKVLPYRTVRENVEVALAVIGLDKKEWDPRVSHVLDLVGLTERIDLFPSQLSGGELQRVSLARALVVNPKIILADEPTGNLDWETAEKIMDLFEKISQEGKTIIMATHHKGIMDNLGERVITLEGGKLTKDTGRKNKKEKKEATAEKTEEKTEKKKK